MSNRKFNPWGNQKIFGIKVRRATFVTFTVIVFTLTVSATGALAQDWPMFRNDPRHAGYSTSSAPTDNTLLWSFETGNFVYSSPAFVDGKVFVASFDYNVYCLDENFGDELWRYQTGDQVQSSPTVVGGRVYVGSDDYKVHCLDAETGEMIWRFPTGREVYSSPTVVDGRVYISSQDENVYCVDAESGEEIWSFEFYRNR